MKRINLEEIRSDKKEPRKFVYLYADDKHPHPRIHQVEHYTDNLGENNLLEAVVVSKEKYKEICAEYKELLRQDNNEVTREHRLDLEEHAYEENFIPTRRCMLVFYHPQAHELRARELRPPKVD